MDKTAKKKAEKQKKRNEKKLERAKRRAGLVAKPADVESYVRRTVNRLRRDDAGVKRVFDDYSKMKGQGDGLCHDLAVGIIEGLSRAHKAKGWSFCQGEVDGGVLHSWVEYGDYRVDMDDDGEPRVRHKSDSAFVVDGDYERRTPKQTKTWADQQLRNRR